MATTEIEKLERRYAENPQGLTFAPLAEVHRKNGDIPRALELLKSGLELHPNYIPASIVLGRCHWDQGELPAAEAAFAHVLRLDDENVIALKSLAEISERLGRPSEAQRWLKRLISIDRSNEEARQHLARLEEGKAEPPPASAPPASVTPASAPPAASAVEVPAAPAAETKPVPEPRQPPEEPAAIDLTAAIAEPTAAPAGKSAAEAPAPSPPLEFLDTSEPAPGIEPATAAASPGTQAAAPPADQPPPVDGLISQEFVPPKEGGYRMHPELTQEFGESTDTIEQLEVETAAEVELESSGGSEFRVPNAAEDFMEAASPPPAPPAPPAFVPPAPPPPAPSIPEPAPVRASYSVRDTRGQSVGAFFQAMLNARPPGATPSTGAAEDAKAPAARSQDASVTFDDFFGAPAGGSGAPKEGSNAGEDDLDQFQSWLQNLKR